MAGYKSMPAFLAFLAFLTISVTTARKAGTDTSNEAPPRGPEWLRRFLTLEMTVKHESIEIYSSEDE